MSLATTDGDDTDEAANRFPTRRAGLIAGQVAMLVVALLLAYVGFSAVIDTTQGRTVDPVLDPDEPGYEAFVEPTPTLVVVGRRADGSLDWVAVLVLGGRDQGGGTVALVPVDSGIPTESGVVTVAAAEAGFASAGVRTFLANSYRVALDDVLELTPGRLEALVAGVGELELTNPDAAPSFPAGALRLPAASAAAYLGAIEDGESQLTRLSRHEAFWTSWLAAIAASSEPDAVPGEATTGIGRFLRGLAAGPVQIVVPPLEAGTTPDGQAALVATEDELADFAEANIPFPASPEPGVRPVVRVLDGIGADGLAEATARDVVAAGAQVSIVGNAERFDPAAPTRVIYVDADDAAAAAMIAGALGVEAERAAATGADPTYDVTVVAGDDLLEAYRLVARTTVPDDQDDS